MKSIKRIAFIAVVFVITFSSCRRPYQEDLYADIESNETAFVIPLEQGTEDGQKQFKSLEYLEKQKVATKRVYIPTIWHQTGRYRHQGKWIPASRVIVVKRAPVTREWTSDNNTGTSSKNEGITVESSNSIAFKVGVTCTGSVPEETTASFLYFYGGKTLEEVMDNNVRSFVQDILTREFGGRDLTGCQKERKAVFDEMKAQTVKFFESRGLRIDNIGAAGDFNYVNSDIQDAINLEFVAEKKNDAAVNEVAAAKKFMEAADAIKKQKELDADINIKNAIAEAIREGKLNVPQSLVMGSGMGLLDIYAMKNLNNAPATK
jgi:hypothetical protein